MSLYTLTILDTPGMQPYIFGSNRLRENVGASDLVWRATSVWPLDILRRAEDKGQRCNVLATNALSPDLCIEKDGLAAEVIYVGGGNTVILFRDHAGAVGFVSQLSRQLLEEAPGLRLAVAHVAVDWEKDCLGGEEGKVDQAMKQLIRNRQMSLPSSPLLGLGVTVDCQSTGMVATTTNAGRKPPEEGIYPISSEVAAKLDQVGAANERLHSLLERTKAARYEIPHDFDDFGRTRGEMSYVAVVHADGNNMGMRVRKITDMHGSPGEGNRQYIQAIRDFSAGIESASLSALRATVDALVEAIDRNAFAPSGHRIPFRPLVFGGDDVTFVCDGRLGLALAVRYLDAFEKATQDQDIKACAGVSVVKTHYPFARAYKLAEDLCASAKGYVRSSGGDFSALDWHFAASGLMGSLSEIRRREYELPDGSNLTMRPVRLRPVDEDWRSWENVRCVIKAFERDEAWAGKRSKVLKLRQVLRQGEARVRQFIAAYHDIPHLPKLTAGKVPEALANGGWHDGRCAYFDPIEAVEFVLEDVLCEGEE